MGYHTGVANGPADLLAKLRVFAANLGWDILRFDSGVEIAGAKAGVWLQVYHPDAGHHSIIADTRIDDIGAQANPNPRVYIFSSQGAKLDSTAFSEQPGSGWKTASTSVNGNGNFVATTNGLRGPYSAYHFFGSTQYLHVAVEITPGEYAHFGLGRLQKNGEFDGGEYGLGTTWVYALDANNNQGANPHSNTNSWLLECANIPRSTQQSCGYIHVNLPNYPNEFARTGASQNAGYSICNTPNKSASSYNQKTNPFLQLWEWTPNTVNGISPFIPAAVMMNLRKEFCYQVGQLPDLRYVNMRNIAPGAEVQFGNDRWLCFPIKTKGDILSGRNHTLNSWRYGVAYLIRESA